MTSFFETLLNEKKHLFLHLAKTKIEYFDMLNRNNRNIFFFQNKILLSIHSTSVMESFLKHLSTTSFHQKASKSSTNDTADGERDNTVEIMVNSDKTERKQRL